MKIDTNIYKRLIEITGGKYNASKNADTGEILISDSKAVIKDLITEFGVLQEEYLDMREKIFKKIEELEEHKFLIDMIDRWTEGEGEVWNRLVDEIKMLKGFLEHDRKQD